MRLLLCLALLCSPAWAAFRAAGSATSVVGGGAATGAPGTPAGAVANDILIIVASQDADPITYTWPSGFTQLYNNTITADGQTVALAWKRAVGSDSLTVTRSSTSGEWLLRCFAWSGRDTTNPPVGSTAATNNSLNASPTTLTSNGVTAVSGDDLVWFGMLDVTAATTTSTLTQPTGYTSRGTTIAGNSLDVFGTATLDNTSAGATGTVAGVLTHSGNSGWAAYLIRIPVAGGGGGATCTPTMALMGVGSCG
jgi:hypothetical protein